MPIYHSNAIVGQVLRPAFILELLTVNDVDAQSDTLLVADISEGITVHTSVSSGGTVTTDTAANIISGVPLSADNETVHMYYINDGSQTLTFAGGNNVAVADTGNTMLINESAILLFRRTSATAVTMYIIGA